MNNGAGGRADRPPTARRAMQSFLQFLIVGLGAGATYALFAQGAVLIYRGSGLVNFAQGAIGTVAAYLAFVDLVGDREWPVLAGGGRGRRRRRAHRPAVPGGRAAGAARRRRHRAGDRDDRAARPAPGDRAQAPRGLEPAGRRLPAATECSTGVATRCRRSGCTWWASPCCSPSALWAWTRYTRVGLAINASAQNERAVQTLGWSPDRLAALTWTIGGMLGGLAAVLAAPLTGLSATTFTIVVTVAGLGAALLGGFRSFPLTLLGGLIIGVGEAMATLYGSDVTDFFNQDLITGLNRMPAFLVIFLVVVAGGRGLPLRSHVVARLPRLGTGQISVPRRAPRVRDHGRAAVRRDGRRVGPGHVHLAGQRHHDPLDRGAHRLRGPDLARPVGVRRHRGADRRPLRARRPRRRGWRSSSGSC